jgi:hypothetical protein
MGGARFGLLDGLLLLALQLAASWAALRLAQAAAPPAWQRTLGLAVASYGAAFAVHIGAFILLGRVLPGEPLHGLRRTLVALVWAAVCGIGALLFARRWKMQTPRHLALLHAVASAAAYAVFIALTLWYHPA